MICSNVVFVFLFLKLNSSLMAVRKVQYDKKLCPLLEQYSKILIFGADNVDSKQLQEIRSALHDHSVVMMGKNTMMRRSLQIYGERTGNKAFLSFIPLIVVSFYASSSIV